METTIDIKAALPAIKAMLRFSRLRKDRGVITIAGRCLRAIVLPQDSAQPPSVMTVTFPQAVVQDESNELAVTPALLLAALGFGSETLSVKTEASQIHLNGVKIDLRESKELLQKEGMLEMPEPDPNRKLARIDLNQTFREGLARVIPARADVDIRHHLKGVLLDVTARRLAATDGHRLHFANSDTVPSVSTAGWNAGDTKWILPSHIVDAIVELGGQSLELYRADTADEGKTRMKVAKAFKHPMSALAVASGQDRDGATSWQLTSGRIEAVFPDIDRVLPPPFEVQVQRWRERRAQAEPANKEQPTGFPVQFRMASCLKEMDAWLRSCHKLDSRNDPALSIDLSTRTLRSMSNCPVAFETAMAELDLPGFEDGNAGSMEKPGSVMLPRVNARYLRDALAALGSAATWTVAPDVVWHASSGDRLQAVLSTLRGTDTR